MQLEEMDELGAVLLDVRSLTKEEEEEMKGVKGDGCRNAGSTAHELDVTAPADVGAKSWVGYDGQKCDAVLASGEREDHIQRSGCSNWSAPESQAVWFTDIGNVTQSRSHHPTISFRESQSNHHKS